jgi:hypothetical protein
MEKLPAGFHYTEKNRSFDTPITRPAGLIQHRSRFYPFLPGATIPQEVVGPILATVS